MPPVETPHGWLVVYHGVKTTVSGSLYRMGLALLDLHTPEQCLRRGDAWVFGPDAPYERFGDVSNIVFPCGYTFEPDHDTLRLYYGAADTCVALATASVQKMLDWLERHGQQVTLGLD
jgi:predicted GH43/DUF377 family glycosyl hydrolase